MPELLIEDGTDQVEGILANRLLRRYTPVQLAEAQKPENRPLYEKLLARAATWPAWEAIDLRGKTDRDGNIIPNVQKIAFDSEADILFAGGAAGGGKSGLIIGMCLMKAVRAMIVRQTALEVKKGIIQDMKRFTNDTDGLSENDGKWDFQTKNLMVNWIGLQTDSDIAKIQGIAYDHIFFDEAPLLNPELLIRVLTWLRTVDPTVRPRAVLTGNPPMSHEGLWLYDFFAPWISENYRGRRAKDGELRWFQAQRDGDGYEETHKDDIRMEVVNNVDNPVPPLSRTMVRFYLHHNPYQPATYAATLMSRPQEERDAMFFGKWNAKLADQRHQIIPTANIREAMDRHNPKTHRDPDYHEPFPVRLSAMGLDPALGGKDNTILTLRFGRVFEKQILISKRDSQDGERIAAIVLEHRIYLGGPDVPVYIDVNGVGALAWSVLKKNIGEFAVAVYTQSQTPWVRIHPETKQAFHNVRAMLYWMMGYATRPHIERPVAIFMDPALRSEFASVRKKRGGGNILQAENKEEVKANMNGKSPDRADSALLAGIGLIVPHKRPIRDMVTENWFPDKGKLPSATEPPTDRRYFYIGTKERAGRGRWMRR